MIADSALRDALATGLDARPSPRSARLASYLARAFGESTVALVHYGSHAYQSDARAESALDFFVIVDDYSDAYRSLKAIAGTRYSPGLATSLNHFLPPNVIAVTEPTTSPPLRAKIAVFSLTAFRRACSSRAPDHFVRGRLFQAVQLVWTRDEESRRAVVDAIVEARAGSFDWGHTALPSEFDTDTYCETLLSASFASEIRPEKRERITALLDAQRATMIPIYGSLLDSLFEAGALARNGDTYSDPHPIRFWDKVRSAVYFRRSKVRATLRWVKYMALYDDWLDYLVLKIARRSGIAIELSPWERRWPLIFLWPKAIRFLRSRPQRQG
jgi:hypothetical protein